MATSPEERKALKAAGYRWHPPTQRWLLTEEIEKYEADLQKAAEVTNLLSILAGIFVVVVTAFTFIVNMR